MSVQVAQQSKSRATYVTELWENRYTEHASPKDLVGRRVRVLNDDINPNGELGAWFVTALDPHNTAHVIVGKVCEYRMQMWSVHAGQLRIRR